MRPLLLMALALPACHSPFSAGGSVDDTDTADTDLEDTGLEDTGLEDTGEPLPELAWCHSAPLPPQGDTVDWDNILNEVITLTSPEHSAQDGLTTDLSPAWIQGKFAYGLVNKDLEGELVEVWVDDCSGQYNLLGEARTTADGTIDFQVPEGALPPIGSFAVLMRVKGDNSEVQATLGVYPVGTQILVTDIDGTLTTSDSELFSDIFADLFEPLFSGDYVPESRGHALELMTLRADQGYPIVYLTGRPYWLTRITRGWLEDEGYPRGTLHLAPSNGDVTPIDSAVGEYKATWLRTLVEKGFVLTGAYGNATTDIYAYEHAPVDKASTWIVGDHGGESGTVDVGDDWTAHWTEAEADLPPAQPFVR